MDLTSLMSFLLTPKSPADLLELATLCVALQDDKDRKQDLACIKSALPKLAFSFVCNNMFPNNNVVYELYLLGEDDNFYSRFLFQTVTFHNKIARNEAHLPRSEGLGFPPLSTPGTKTKKKIPGPLLLHNFIHSIPLFLLRAANRKI